MGISDWAQKANTWFTSRFKLSGQVEQDSAVGHNPMGGSTGLRIPTTSYTKKFPRQEQSFVPGGYPADFSGMQAPVVPDYVAQGFPGYGQPAFDPYGQSGGYVPQTGEYVPQPQYGYDQGYNYGGQTGHQTMGGQTQQGGYPPQPTTQQRYTQPQLSGYPSYEQAQQGQQGQPTGGNISYPTFPAANETAQLPRIRITQLHSVQECYRIIEFMRDQEVVVVNTEPIASDQEVQRCIDMISGAAFTLSCSLTRITRAERAYLISPSRMEALAEYQFHGMTDQDVVRRGDMEFAGQSRLGSVAGRYRNQESPFAADRARRSTAHAGVR